MSAKLKHFLSKGWPVAKYLIAATLFAYLISFTDRNALINTLQHASLPILLVVFGLFLFEVWLTTLRFWILLNRNIPFFKLLEVNVLQKSIAAVLSSGAGFITYITELKLESDINWGTGATSFLFAKLGDIFAIGLLLPLATILTYRNTTPLHALVWILSLSIFIGFVLLLIGILYNEKAIAILDIFWQKTGLESTKYGQKIRNLITKLFTLEKTAAFHLACQAFSLSLLLLLLNAFWGYLLNLAFNIHISFWAIIFMISLQRLMSYIPIYVFGGIGIGDITAMYLYSLFGFSQATVVPVLIGVRIWVYGMNTAILLFIPFNKLWQKISSH